MNNIVGVEEIPQLIPAECSFNGSDKSTNSFFIRVVNPGLYTDTLLISETFMEDLAKVSGFCRVTEAQHSVEELRGAISNADITLDACTAQLSHLRATLADLETLEARLSDLRKLLAKSKAFANGAQPSNTEPVESPTES